MTLQIGDRDPMAYWTDAERADYARAHPAPERHNMSTRNTVIASLIVASAILGAAWIVRSGAHQDASGVAWQPQHVVVDQPAAEPKGLVPPGGLLANK